MLHKDVAAGEIHTIANWIVANAAARAALVLVPADVHKIAYQTDTGIYYALTDDSPATWAAVNSAAAAATLIYTQVSRNAVQSIANASVVVVSWDTEVVDTAAAFDIAAPTKITVPAGYTKVKLAGKTAWASNSTGVRTIFLTKNGVNITLVPSDHRNAQSESSANFATPWLTVVAGDYFELSVFQTSGAALNLSGSAVSYGPTWLEAEFRA